MLNESRSYIRRMVASQTAPKSTDFILAYNQQCSNPEVIDCFCWNLLRKIQRGLLIVLFNNNFIKIIYFTVRVWSVSNNSRILKIISFINGCNPASNQQTPSLPKKFPHINQITLEQFEIVHVGSVHVYVWSRGNVSLTGPRLSKPWRWARSRASSCRTDLLNRTRKELVNTSREALAAHNTVAAIKHLSHMLTWRPTAADCERRSRVDWRHEHIDPS